MTASTQALRIASVAVEAAEDKLAKDILVLDVSEKLGIAEVFVIVSGSNERQVGAIVDEIEERSIRAGVKPLRREGNREDPWVLLDFFDTIVHVQHQEARVTYALDRLWKDCPVIELETPGSSKEKVDL
ncbi:MAG: ribosome silencing factor [Propionibacteriaceae bacterium]|jgi:ribosome-associated protein|nr:ribosome silencing factor [Propionibacteriaceae bacterium]